MKKKKRNKVLGMICSLCLVAVIFGMAALTMESQAESETVYEKVSTDGSLYGTSNMNAANAAGSKYSSFTMKTDKLDAVEKAGKYDWNTDGWDVPILVDGKEVTANINYYEGGNLNIFLGNRSQEYASGTVVVIPKGKYLHRASAKIQYGIEFTQDYSYIWNGSALLPVHAVSWKESHNKGWNDTATGRVFKFELTGNIQAFEEKDFWNYHAWSIPVSINGETKEVVMRYNAGMFDVMGTGVAASPAMGTSIRFSKGIYMSNEGTHAIELKQDSLFVWEGSSWILVDSYYAITFTGPSWCGHGSWGWEETFSVPDKIEGLSKCEWDTDYWKVPVVVNGKEEVFNVRYVHEDQRLDFSTTALTEAATVGTTFQIQAGVYVAVGTTKYAIGIDRNYTYVWNGETWVETETLNEVSFTGVLSHASHNGTYWEMGLRIPAAINGLKNADYMQNMWKIKAEVSGKEYDWEVHYDKNDSKFVFFTSHLKGKPKAGTILKIRSGNYVSEGTVKYGIHIKQDYLFFYNGTGWTMLNYDISEYRSGSAFTYPFVEGYVFAGWYSDSSYKKPLAVSAKSGYAYAKFVPESIIKVYFQNQANGSGKTDARLVTTVDSLLYQNIGFELVKEKGGKKYGKTITSDTVYHTIKGGNKNYTPEAVGGETAKYFMTTVFTIPNTETDTELSVVAFWTTEDGTKVKGETRTVTTRSLINGYNMTGCPDYSDSDLVLPIGAYCGPRRAGTEYIDGERTVTHNVSYVTDEGFKDFTDAGFNYVFSEYDAQFEDTEHLDTYMKLAAKYGVDVYVSSYQLNSVLRQSGNTLTDAERTLIKERIDALQKYEACKGIMMADEPELEYLLKYRAVTDYMKSQDSKLHPLCAGLPLSYYYKDTTVYPGMIDSLAESFGEFVYDFYPFNVEKNWTHYLWMQNLMIVADRCQGKYNAGVTIQSHGAGELRDVGEKEISFQAYTALAYGMKRLGYYTYWEHFSQTADDRFTSAMVMWDDRSDPSSKAHKTEVYNAAKKINQELLNFDHVYMNFDWQGTQILNKKNSARFFDKIVAFDPILDYQSPRIASLTGNDDVIVGCLKDHNSYDGFMLVNATDPSSNLSVEGDIRFYDADKAIVYVHGEPQTVSLNKGTYHYNLASGEGVFIIPYVTDYKTYPTEWLEAVSTNGRCVKSTDGNIGLFWTNSGISFRFTGTGVRASVAVTTTDEAARGYLNVYVDGAIAPSKTICLDKTSGVYVLAENLSAGEHVIEVRKRNEAIYGGSASITLKKLDVIDGCLRSYNKKATRRIEVIGDSITSGYGNMISDGSGDYTTATTDGTMTYAVIAARQLGADVSILSRSGIAYSRGLDSPYDSMYDYYTKTAALPNNAFCNTEWDFANNPSDVVVINLGTNDNYAKVNGTPVTDAYMTSEAVAFLKLVREKNPNAVIIWTYGMYEQNRTEAIRSAVAQRNSEGDSNVFYLQMKQADKDTEGLGTHLHPSIKTNIDRSFTLAEFIAQKTGWTVDTEVRSYYQSLHKK